MYKFTGFNEKANKVLNACVEIAEDMGHTYIGSEHLLMGLIREDTSLVSSCLASSGVKTQNVEPIVKKIVGIGIPTVLTPNDFSPRCRHIIETSISDAKQLQLSQVGTQQLFCAIAKEGESCASYVLSELDVSIVSLAEDLKSGGKKSGSNLSEGRKSHGKSTTANLDKYGQDLTKKARNSKIDPVLSREKEIERVIQILARRSKNNPCLIGEPGVGKTAIAEGLALKIAMGEVPDLLSSKKVISLDLTSMVAGTKYRGDFEERIKNCIDEVIKNGDIILFIDEMHNLIGTGSAEGAVDAANILKPSLARSELQVIGATTLKEYKKHIEKDSALERRFQPIFVQQPTQQQSIEILNGIKSKYEIHHGVKITDGSIKAAVELSTRYICDRFLPDKAIDLIDEACSKVRLRGYIMPDEIKSLKKDLDYLYKRKSIAVDNQEFELATKLRDEEKNLQMKIASEKMKWRERNNENLSQVTKNEVAEVVSSWTSIPLEQLSKDESVRLLEMEKVLHKKIIGQDKAVSAVARAIRRSRAGIKDPKRPMGSFIFLGPTGVGKTELCKALAKAMFADENALIRFDMSEFMQKQSSSKLIGSPPGYVGYEESGQLTEKVRRKPYSIILFDEIEKAHPDIFGLLLQILDDGQLTDSQGTKVSFLNTIIIMTSNLGAKTICGEGQSIGFSGLEGGVLSDFKINDAVTKELKQTFKPEFLNRVDEIVVFHKLSKDDVEKITRLMLEKLQQRLKSLEIEMSFSDDVVKTISRLGYDENYGARALTRKIQTVIEDELSEQMLMGKMKKGEQYECDMVNEKLELRSKKEKVVSNS